MGLPSLDLLAFQRLDHGGSIFSLALRGEVQYQFTYDMQLQNSILSCENTNLL